MAYPSRSQIVAASNVPELTGASTVQQDAWYAEAKRAVEAFCQQRFDSVDEELTFDGDGSRRLPLPKRLAVLDTLTISEPLTSSLSAADVYLTNDHDALVVKPDAWSGGTWATRVLREGRRPVFPQGYGTVKIDGTWGWATGELAADATSFIGVAMRLDMEDLAQAQEAGLAATVRGLVPAGVSSISEGPLSIQLSGGDGVPDVSLPAAAQSILADYIWQPVPVGG